MKALISRLANFINTHLSNYGIVIKQTRRLPEYNFLGLTKIPINSILDIGANEGQFAHWIRRFFPHAKLFSFEPVPPTFDALKIKSASDSKWNVFNIALSNANGHAIMNFHALHSSSSSFLETTVLEETLYPETRSQTKISVPCYTLDSWASQHQDALHAPILIKMDVQGFEGHVLAGGSQTFAQASIVIAEIIIASLYAGQASFTTLTTELSFLGFDFRGVLEHGFDDKGNLISIDAVFTRNLDSLIDGY